MFHEGVETLQGNNWNVVKMGVINPNFQHEDSLDQDVFVIQWQYGVYIFYWSEMLWKISKPNFQISTTAVLNSIWDHM